MTRHRWKESKVAGNKDKDILGQTQHGTGNAKQETQNHDMEAVQCDSMQHVSMSV